MKWDIFANRNKGRNIKKKDEIDEIIEVIEKTAPRKYRADRETFYYNYRIVPIYTKPLLALLETISRSGRFEGADLARDLFLKLKDFYDPKDKLSLAEAIEDSGLKKKFRELILFFNGEKDLPVIDMKEWLKEG